MSPLGKYLIEHSDEHGNIDYALVEKAMKKYGSLRVIWQIQALGLKTKNEHQ
jgi:hypothetical protein